MYRLSLRKRHLIFILVFLNIFFSISMAFAFWASDISSSDTSGNGSLDIGEWGIPIFTVDDFYEFATKSTSASTDLYYLANDLDFTGYSWTYVSSVIFRGELNGRGKTISNLNIYVNGGNYHGIFPRMLGGRIYDLTFDNIHIDSGLSGTSQRSGMIAGQITGGTNLISNLTLNNIRVEGASTNGVGGLVGLVSGSSTVLTIENIKATELKVFNRYSYTGGLVGRQNNSGSVVNMYDIDIQTEVFSLAASSYSGGLIGRTVSGGILDVNRAIVEAEHINTFVTSFGFNTYSPRYLGGLIGYNLSQTTNVTLSNILYTGSLFNNLNNRRNNVGTVSGRQSFNATLTDVYYSFVAFRSSTGTVIYTPDISLTGQNGTLVSATSLPTVTWWNNAYTTFSQANNLWQQDPVTGRLELIRS